ncbi:MAG TPA: serine/threonine-protein kinase [Polyangiaceae bacterium LLY-WYZ-15_(1-7)]|nr:hypothetical protein [Myxococcales bacterium]MAT23945.1 hypothetical protein [Sandaracinus sp.]HJK90463.1 serine/threonine-protein kinase [Polyangiaceae bacterium LLY-WYZ-15_(1-7)]MBJ71603.1 hypothetical protein [Sandaracinus sp.]HJL00571.1 serine/threonine-protein kinase [Polyangiaceae bacterium LLY-WYZ-15_(1-7)]
MSAGEAPLTFGRYEALFHIASGGMAEVFAARLRGPHGFEKLVAVKRLLPSLADDQFVTMFLDEARLAANITSPHVVQTLELGRAEDDGALYIVMELVVGVTLYDLCVNIFDGPQRQTPVAHVAEIMAQAARGLDDAHNATTPTGQALHVVHRDVSPQNILVGVDGRVRVTDFGIARAVSRTTKTRVGQLKGKVAYLSPEQAMGQALDRRSDVFALGVVSWEALTGRSLFNTGDPVETVERVRELPIPSPRELRGDVPEEVASVVMWALERDVERRCPSAAEFARAMRGAVAERPGPAEIGKLVREHGGAPLQRVQNRMNELHQGQSETVMRPPPEKSGARIVPDAELPDPERLMGPSERPPPPPGTDPVHWIQSKSSRPPPPQAAAPSPPAKPAGDDAKQRDLSTELVSKEHAEHEPGDAAAPSPLERRRQRVRVGVAVAIGVVAWLGAGALAWYVLASGPEAGEGPVLIAPGDPTPE